MTELFSHVLILGASTWIGGFLWVCAVLALANLVGDLAYRAGLRPPAAIALVVVAAISPPVGIVVLGLVHEAIRQRDTGAARGGMGWHGRFGTAARLLVAVCTILVVMMAHFAVDRLLPPRIQPARSEMVERAPESNRTPIAPFFAPARGVV